ncbi:hypothetical protein JCM10212_005738 [Sporobolomyces blumeae]
MPRGRTVQTKVAYTTPDGQTTLRKFSLDTSAPPSATYSTLVDSVSSRFGLVGQVIDLVYEDEEGDQVTLSSDVELDDLVRDHVISGKKQSLRFQVKTRSTAGGDTAAHQDDPAPVEPLSTETCASSTRLLDEDSPAGLTDEDIPKVESKDDPTSPEILFEDPDETPLPSPSRFARDRIASEFPTSGSSSTPSTATGSHTHPGSFAEDPLDIPLPAPTHESLPFANLPNSLSGFLASLGTRSSVLSSTLTSALSPTSPTSPTSRLSSILSTSSLDDIPLIASSLAQMGSEFAEIAKEVARGVRQEADEIRDEFGRLRHEVERERERFREDFRDALHSAAREAGSTADAQGSRDAETSSLPAAPTTPSTTSSVAPEDSTVPARATFASPTPSTASRSECAGDDATATIPTRDTARMLHKQAKQARKEYRAAVRQAREERRDKARQATVDAGLDDGADGIERSTVLNLPGGMPVVSTSAGREEKEEQ